MMRTTVDNGEWICDICGAMESDDESENFEQHIKKHKITEEQYDEFVMKKGGVSQLRVKLLSWSNNVELAIMSFVCQTWGATFDLSSYTQDEIDGIVDMALSGKTLPLALESIQFTFQIDNLSRAISHQLVRVRVGSSFSQKGMSDTNYENESFIIPAAIEAVGKTDEYCELMRGNYKFYSELVNLGVPFQEARYVLPHASTTSLVWSVNLLSLRNFCMNRMCSTQSWEINTLCKLIKKEVKKVYPKIAKCLDSRCTFTKECHSFGNLYEGCGKYSLKDTNRKFVFSKEQMAKNIQFTEEYRDRIREHNLNVKPRNNYFLDKVSEKKNDEIISGKYDEGLQEEKKLIEQGYTNCKDRYTYQQISQSFLNIKLKMMNVSPIEQHNKNTLTKEEKEMLITSAYNMAYFILDKCNLDFNYSPHEALEKCWNIHVSKNRLYQDGWYKNGLFGIFYDLNRKMSRLDSIINENLEDCIETKKDTCLDLLNYCIMFAYGLKNTNICMFEGM